MNDQRVLTGTFARIGGHSGSRRWSHRTVQIAFVAVDIAVVTLTSWIAQQGYHAITYSAPPGPRSALGLGVIVSALLVLWLQRDGAYRIADMLHLGRQVRRLLLTWAGILALFALAVFSFRIGADFSRGAVFSFAVIAPGVLITCRFVWRLALLRALRSGALRGRKIVLVGRLTPQSSAFLVDDFTRHGHEIVQAVDGSDLLEAGDIAGFASKVLAAARGSAAEEIVLLADNRVLAHLVEVKQTFATTALAVNMIPVPEVADLVFAPRRDIGTAMGLQVQSGPLTESERMLKRSFDVTLAGLALVMCAPMMALVALAIRLDSPGPVLFRQTRHGFNGRPFRIFKFRTMTVMEDGAVVRQATRGDQRVTRVGRVLRRTSLDELPQLLNVLLGDMSMVGPRPHAVAHDTYFGQLIASYAQRHHVKPGLTGLAQVNGFRGETPTLESMSQRVQYDLRYVDQWSLWLDIKIVLKTAWVVLHPNAY
jgi:Undecaprenyl-phosphate glucose phosphotransferase